jgi:hypothetical protein
MARPVPVFCLRRKMCVREWLHLRNAPCPLIFNEFKVVPVGIFPPNILREISFDLG